MMIQIIKLSSDCKAGKKKSISSIGENTQDISKAEEKDEHNAAGNVAEDLLSEMNMSEKKKAITNYIMKAKTRGGVRRPCRHSFWKGVMKRSSRRRERLLGSCRI